MPHCNKEVLSISPVCKYDGERLRGHFQV